MPNVDDAGRGHETSLSYLSISPYDLASMIWRRKWYLAGSVVISLALGAAYLYQADPVYEVTARVLVQQKSLSRDHDKQLRQAREFVATQSEVLNSPAIVTRAVESLAASALQSQNAHRENPPTAEDPVALTLSNLSVRPVAGTNVLSIGLRCADAEEGVRTVQAIVASYQQFLRAMDHDFQLGALGALARSERGLREELKSLEDKYRKLHKDSPLLGQGKDLANVRRALLEQLGQTLTTTTSRRIELENRVRAMIEADNGRMAFRDSDHHTPAAGPRMVSLGPR